MQSSAHRSRKVKTSNHPYLVHHHHGQKIANRGEEQPVQIMFDIVADGVAEDVENDLTNDEEKNAKRDVPQRPSILERIGDENDLHDDVYQQAYAVDQIKHHKETQSVGWAQPQLVLEGQDRNRPGNQEHANRGASQQPHGLGGAIFVQLKAHKAIDQEASAQGGCESILHGGEIGVYI